MNWEYVGYSDYKGQSKKRDTRRERGGLIALFKLSHIDQVRVVSYMLDMSQIEAREWLRNKKNQQIHSITRKSPGE